jgi:hypothetical protein
MASSKKDANSDLAKQEKANCIIIRAQGTNEECLTNVQSILPYLTPVILKKYGDEYKEKEELISKYGMPNDLCEIGKFYDHEGSKLWYYYVYGVLTEKSGLHENVIASRLLDKDIYGDIAIVRSGPTTSNIDPWLSMDKLAQTIMFYETNDSKMIFDERERQRFYEQMGIGDQCPLPTFLIRLGFN